MYSKVKNLSWRQIASSCWMGSSFNGYDAKLKVRLTCHVFFVSMLLLVNTTEYFWMTHSIFVASLVMGWTVWTGKAPYIVLKGFACLSPMKRWLVFLSWAHLVSPLISVNMYPSLARGVQEGAWSLQSPAKVGRTQGAWKLGSRTTPKIPRKELTRYRQESETGTTDGGTDPKNGFFGVWVEFEESKQKFPASLILDVMVEC
jgi:hypothetical protein